MIAIIAILAAILFPVFAKARAKARQTACLSNMKQLGTGLMMYAQDYDETLAGNDHRTQQDDGVVDNGDVSGGQGMPLGFMDPGAYRNWAKGVYPYVKNFDIYICPESLPRTVLGASAAFGEVEAPGAGNTSYLLNGVANARAIAEITRPADIIFLHEARLYYRVAQARPWRELFQPKSSNQYTSFNHPMYDWWHNEGANLLFCDGHAKWQRKSAIRYEQFGCPPSLPFNAGKPLTFAEGDAGSNAQNQIRYQAEF